MRKAELHLVLPELRKAIATATGLASPEAPTAANKSALWAFAAVESLCTETWSVLVPFGSLAEDGPNRCAIQVYTQGRSVAEVLARLAQIHGALTEQFGMNDQEPRRSWLIGTSPDQWLVDIFELEEGTPIGNLDQARVDGSLNFLLAYRRQG